MNEHKMETLFERITHWKTTDEWRKINEVFTAATTLDRYYKITLFAQLQKSKNSYHYREAIVADKEFIRKFGCLDVEYLKYAQKIMRKKYKY